MPMAHRRKTCPLPTDDCPLFRVYLPPWTPSPALSNASPTTTPKTATPSCDCALTAPAVFLITGFDEDKGETLLDRLTDAFIDTRAIKVN